MNRSWVSIVIVATVLAAGCATRPAVTPQGTSESGMGRQHVWQAAEGFRGSEYRHVIVEPFNLDAVDGATPPDLAGKLRSEFTADLEHASLLTTESAHDVLRVRVHVTGINRSRPAVNFVAAALLFVPVDMGGASLTAELVDAQNGRVVATLTDSTTSTPLNIKGSFSEYGHAEAAFRHWGEELRKFLTQEPIG